MALLKGDGLPTLVLPPCMKQLTGQDIHAAFVSAMSEGGKPPLIDEMGEWDKVNPRSRELYSKMADYLNMLL